jgi:hypothetical protein
MKKTQLKTLATKIHGLAVKSANGKKTVQNAVVEYDVVHVNAEFAEQVSDHDPKVARIRF